jgi:hypothetical protein
MMTEQQERLVSLLLGTFPNFQSGDAEAALTAYAMVVTGADPRDVEPGIMMLIKGELAGFDGRFAPTATQLARAIRTALEQRVDRENAERRRLPPPPEEDFPEPTPEQRARVKNLMDQVKRSYGSERSDQEAKERYRAQLRRTNERFDHEAFSTFNAADDDQHDMGQARAS